MYEYMKILRDFLGPYFLPIIYYVKILSSLKIIKTLKKLKGDPKGEAMQWIIVIQGVSEVEKEDEISVENVIVYKDPVEVIFNGVFTILKEYEAYKIKSSIYIYS